MIKISISNFGSLPDRFICIPYTAFKTICNDKTAQIPQHFVNFLEHQQKVPVWVNLCPITVATDFCSWLTGEKSDMVLLISNQSALRFDMV